jgi:hypothetical protein
MLNSGRDIFQKHLYANYNPIPPRSMAPEIGTEIGEALWPFVSGQLGLYHDVWIVNCKRFAAEFLRTPAPGDDDLQQAFNFYKTPKGEQVILNRIGRRRMESPDDGSMVDLVNPGEASSQELFRLADKLDTYGKHCIERAKYIRQLARSRQNRGL